MRWPGRSGGDGETVKLAREADREIADVDHFLDFAEAFGRDLAGLDRDQLAQGRLVIAQLVPEQANELAPFGCGNRAPFL